MVIPLITAFNVLGGPAPLYIAVKARAQIVAQQSQYNENPQKVMIRGTISSVGTGALAIGEHTIYIDPAKTGSFRQMGTIETGARAEVKARRVGDLLYAEQVIIVGTGQGRTQIVLTANHQPEEINDANDESKRRASINADTQTTLWVKAKGSLEQLALYLKNALKLFASVSI